ncbi:serine aminopeptidase domain-containing protein [Variovorax saccharolyticus]|uniref:serine aminopeptidase domain-containing protein n=1 Tax=Variovorax saccharolyticus TaxID=3053516 RepID=UPI002578A0E8|nr:MULTISPECIES: alpha/beta hydrolase [unclassified Variovorax]MDM0017770.1 alpha/beta hydrolase [Variovorax sp. J22R187]MDM0024742.1 alpha/beta hydrolase [Variovorax sp. J31P216]
MNPFYFGPADRQLFAIYHAPERETESRAALLMCCPYGHEAIRVHRLYRVLAERIARLGIAVLRFDFFGTGESGGDDADGEMQGWQRDLLDAHEELQRRSGARTTTWLAARLGATLALQTAKRAPGLDRLILWDPILDGPAYVEELHAAQIAMLEIGYYASNPSWYQRRAQGDGPAITEALGHRISGELSTQWAALRPDGLTLDSGAKTTVLSRPEDGRSREWCLRESTRGRPVEHEMLEHPIDWTSDPIPNQAIVPVDVTRRLLALMR